MNRRRFLLGSSALVAAAAVAKALPAGAIEFPPTPTSWGETTWALTDFGSITPAMRKLWSDNLWAQAMDASFFHRAGLVHAGPASGEIDGADLLDGDLSWFDAEPAL